MDRMTFTHALMKTPDRDHPDLTRADVIEHGTVTAMEILHDPAEFVARGVFTQHEALYPATTLAAWYVKELFAWTRKELEARYYDPEHFGGFAVHRDRASVICRAHIQNDFERAEEDFLILFLDEIDGVHYSWTRYPAGLGTSILNHALNAVDHVRYTEFWEPLTDEIAESAMPPGVVFHCCHTSCGLGWVRMVVRHSA